MQIDALIGKQLGDFVIVERIGQGGMATVYRAEQPAMKRDVAIKVINMLDASENQDFYRRFENESAVIASLEHVRILPVHDYGIEGNYAYLAMRYLRGGTLKDLLRKQRLTLDRTLALFEQIASGLAYAHSKGIIHRDLKPANIMLDDNQNAYLTDFGLAKMVRGEGDSTKSGHIVGTVTNMAPEQLRGETLDHRADIYSLGIILYEMAVGHSPFQHEKHVDIITLIYQHLEDEPDPPSTFDPDIPPELEKTIMKAIAKRPDQRFSSVSEMVQSLSPITHKSNLITTEFPGVSQSLLDRARVTDSIVRSRSEIRRFNNNPMMITGIVAVIVIILFGILLVSSEMLSTVAQPTETPTPTDTPSPTAIPLHTVQVGEDANSEDIVPTEDQMVAARAKLGTNGFVAVIACNLSSEYHATLNREIRTFLNDYGLNSRVYDSGNDEYAQIPILEGALAEGAMGVILCALHYDLLENPLETIEERHLPYINLSREENLYGGVQLSSNTANYDMGYAVGQFAGEIISDEMDGEANVVILDFPSMDIIVDRADGLEAGVLEEAPDVNIVGRYLGAIADNGYNSVKQLIEDEVEFDVILSINDAGTYGAIDAMEEAEITPDEVFIASVDAERKAIDYMLQGRFIRGTLSVGRQETAMASANLMTMMLAGATVPENIVVESGNMVTVETLQDAE